MASLSSTVKTATAVAAGYTVVNTIIKESSKKKTAVTGTEKKSSDTTDASSSGTESGTSSGSTTGGDTSGSTSDTGSGSTTGGDTSGTGGTTEGGTTGGDTSGSGDTSSGGTTEGGSTEGGSTTEGGTTEGDSSSTTESDSTTESNVEESDASDENKKDEDTSTETESSTEKDLIMTLGDYTLPYYDDKNVTNVRWPIVDTVCPVMGLPPMSISGGGLSAVSSFINGISNAADSMGLSSVSSSLKSVNSTIDSAVNSALSNPVVGALASAYTAISSSSSTTYNTYQQMLQSFPILTIEPLSVSYRSNESNQSAKKSVDASVLPVKYRFAVMPESLTISYRHTNNYGESKIESTLKDMFQGGTVNELYQLANTSGGMFGGKSPLARSIANAADSANQGFKRTAGNLIQDMTGENITGGFKDDANVLRSLATTMLSTIMDGAKIDFPDIWQNSSTDSRQTFEIKLVTLSQDPTQKKYWCDIIVPLYCLLTLALPKGDTSSTYTNPPYIRCTLDDGYYQAKLAGIESISWNIPASKLNYLKVPREIDVSITIVDMYNIMTQGVLTYKEEDADSSSGDKSKKSKEKTSKYAYKDNEALNLMTKDKMFDRFLNMTDGKTIANEKIMANEWGEFISDTESTIKSVVNGVSSIVSSLSGNNDTSTSVASVRSSLGI